MFAFLCVMAVELMTDFIPGQRWISNTESELGLGLILEVNFKRVTVLFLASDERRIYASDNAPLTRVSFAIGDTIEGTMSARAARWKTWVRPSTASAAARGS